MQQTTQAYLRAGWVQHANAWRLLLGTLSLCCSCLLCDFVYSHLMMVFAVTPVPQVPARQAVFEDS